jgi:Ala-tRNA(Pro) deacylase
VSGDPAPHMNPEGLLALLRDLGIQAETVTHRPVFTVEEAKEHRGALLGAHTKNLFLRDKKGVMWLAVVLESQQVDLRALAAQLGHRRFSFGSADRLMRHLGVRPGSVTPFGLVNDHEGAVRVALDASLHTYEWWNFHPLVNSMTTTIRAADMVRFLEAVNHPPTWVDFD